MEDVMKNFETLEEGCWYQTRHGMLVRVTQAADIDEDTMYPWLSSGGGEDVWRDNGQYTDEPAGHYMDLILKIKPPTITPLPQKKKKRKARLYKWIEIRPDGEEIVTLGYAESIKPGAWGLCLGTNTPQRLSQDFTTANKYVRIDRLFKDVEVEE
jgi:hypothetical protein